MLHCRESGVESYSSLTALEDELLKHNFFRCHSSFLVNLAQAAGLLTKDLRLYGGVLIPVSKHRRKDLAVAITDYWGRKPAMTETTLPVALFDALGRTAGRSGITVMLAAILVFSSNLTDLFGMTSNLPLSLPRQLILIVAGALAVSVPDRVKMGNALFIAVVYGLGLGIWFNVLTPFTIFQMVGVSNIPASFSIWAVRILRLCGGGLTLWILGRWFIRMDPEDTLDHRQTALRIFPALVNYFTMIIFHHSVFSEKTLMTTRYGTAFAWMMVLLAVSSLAVLITTSRYIYFQRQQEQINQANLKLQVRYEMFERQRQSDETLRALRHDMNNHLNTLSGLVEDGGRPGHISRAFEKGARRRRGA